MSGVVAHDVAASAGGATPLHVAIIMDGNGRWAKNRRLPRIAGHRQGVEAIRKAVHAAPGLGIGILTLYAFSSENWKRPQEEVNDLMGLLRHYLRQEVAELHRSGVRMEVIGDYRSLQPDLVTLIDDARHLTRDNQGLTLIIALNYGSQDELARVARQLAAEAREGRIEPESIDAALIESRLDTAKWPAPDLLIRTSGEIRLSNFLLWQLAYSELRFVDTLWPDFDEAELAAAVSDYACRQRRFGGL